MSGVCRHLQEGNNLVGEGGWHIQGPCLVWGVILPGSGGVVGGQGLKIAWSGLQQGWGK